MKKQSNFFFMVLLASLPIVPIFGQSASGTKPEFLLNRNNSSNQPPNKIPVTSGDTLGWLRWRGWTPTEIYSSGAEIRAYVSGAPVGNYIPSNMVFKVGKGLPDRMIILDNGYVGVNTPAPQFALDVETDARVKANLRIGGNGKIALKESLDKLIINPANNFANHVRVESDLEVTGTMTVANLNVVNNLSVGNDAAIGHDLTVGHNAAVTNDLSVGNNAAVAKNLSVGQNATVTNDLTVNHNAAVTNDLTVGNNAAVAKNLSVGQNATVTNDLTVNHNAAVANDLAVGNNA
ncbi:MAG: hypothetical protein H7246_06065, partial [Phycisphaerae bacterium]|nr:hypothetical protein [Saprospiraceae bacterium]